MLEHSETLELIAKAQNGDDDAKTVLLEHNSPLIKSIIRRYKNKGVEYDDLYQLGCMGFLKAIKNFDVTYEVRFSTYAVPMIAGEVKRFLRDDGAIKVSRQIKLQASTINKYIEEYKIKTGNSPTLEKLSEEFKIEAQELVFILDSNKVPISIYDKNEENDQHNMSLIEKLGVENNEDILDKLMIKDLINELEPREKQIVLLRFFRDKTQSQIAAIMGVSQVQVSRIENKIITKLRRKLS